uniref:Retrotransposon gag domain-containing protein n=1 Tax=Aegilops tauschii subsp. strangulata TaxID=200361 RepID=A0A453G838_AEGTS
IMVLVRYGVTHLIEHPPPPNADAAYLELDAHVALWIYATLSDAMVDHVVGATTTFAIWKKIHDYFLSNRAARFMILNRQYRNLKQGDLSVQEYARRIKLLTDGLADIEHAVTEVDLTTQFLHGLDKRLDTIRVVLGDQGLPFDVVLSRVSLAEESMAQRSAEESASVFALHNGSPSSGSSSSTGGPRGDRSGERTPGPSPHPPA